MCKIVVLYCLFVVFGCLFSNKIVPFVGLLIAQFSGSPLRRLVHSPVVPLQNKSVAPS